jgi:hypothetical protein
MEVFRKKRLHFLYISKISIKFAPDILNTQTQTINNALCVES